MFCFHETVVARFARLTLLGGMVGLLLLLTDLPVRAGPAPDQPKKEEPKKEEPKKVDPKDAVPFPQFPDVPVPPGFDAEQFKRIQMEHLRIREEARKQIEELRRGLPGAFPDANNFFLPPNFQADFVGSDRRPRENRLGANLESPSPALVEQLDLPKDQGIVLNDFKVDSPASKAGMKKNDILLELDGKAVPSKIEDAVKLFNDIKPNTPVDATVLRKGKKETVKGISLPEIKAEEKPRPGAVPVPNVAAPPLPNPPPLLPPGGLPQGADNSSIQMIRTPTSFTTRYAKNGGYIALSGKMVDDKAVVEEITISTGRDTKKFKTVDEVPEEAREQVKTLLKMTEKGTASTAELENKPKN